MHAYTCVSVLNLTIRKKFLMQMKKKGLSFPNKKTSAKSVDPFRLKHIF